MGQFGVVVVTQNVVEVARHRPQRIDMGMWVNQRNRANRGEKLLNKIGLRHGSSFEISHPVRQQLQADHGTDYKRTSGLKWCAGAAPEKALGISGCKSRPAGCLEQRNENTPPEL